MSAERIGCDKIYFENAPNRAFNGKQSSFIPNSVRYNVSDTIYAFSRSEK